MTGWPPGSTLSAGPSPHTHGFAERRAPSSQCCFRWGCLPAGTMTQSPETSAPLGPSSSSPWRAAQRPFVGQQHRQQASLWVTHHVAISFVWLAGSLLEASVRLRGRGQGRRRPLPSGALRGGDGSGTGAPFMWQGGSLHVLKPTPRAPQRRRLAQARPDVRGLVWARITAAAREGRSGPRQAFLSSRSPERTHLYEK